MKMITNRSYQKVPNINHILKQDYFFKNYDHIQKALKPIKKIKRHIYYPKDSKLNTMINKEVSDDKQNVINTKNPAKEVTQLFNEYNQVEQVSLTHFRKINNENKQFTSSYREIRKENTKSHDKKNQFDVLLNKYSQCNYSLSKNILHRSPFNSTPLLLKTKQDLILYFLQNNYNKNKIPRHLLYHSLESKGEKYIKRLNEYSTLIRQNKMERENSINKSKINICNIREDIIELNDKINEKKIINENQKIRRQIKIISGTINQLEDNVEGLKKEIINGNHHNSRQFNKTERKTGNQLWNSLNSTTGISFFSPSKKKIKGIPLIKDMNHNDITDNQSQSSSTRYNYKSLCSFRSPGVSADRSRNNTCLIRDSSRLPIDDIYNFTKSSSFFNNNNSPINIINYFKNHTNNTSNLLLE